ncbi:MAG: flippase-like domain-containing protein [Bacilli bacterium]
MGFWIVGIIGILTLIFVVYSIIPTVYVRLFHGYSLYKLSGKNQVAFTFDDGVRPVYTENILDVLNKHNVKGTFFVIATQAEKYPFIVQRIIDEGHSLGMHSYAHDNALFQTLKQTKQDFEKSMAIFQRNNWPIHYYRPPWGHVNLTTLWLLRKYDITLIMWSMMVGDWTHRATKHKMMQKMKENISSGDIICLHDGRSEGSITMQMTEALDETLPKLVEKQLECVSLNEETLKVVETEEKKHSFLWSGIFLIVVIALTFYLFLKDQNIFELWATILSMNPMYVGISIFSVLLFIGFEAINYKIVFAACGEKVSFLRNLKYAFIGFFYCSITPSASGGQPMQMYYMKKDNINLSYSSLNLLVVILIYQIVTLLYCVVALLFDYALIMEKMQGVWYFFWFGLFVNVVTAFFILWIIFSDKVVKRFLYRMIQLLSKVSIIKNKENAERKVDTLIEEYKEGAHLIRKNTGAIAYVFFFTFLQKTAMYSVTYWVYRGFGLDEYSMFSIIGLQSMLYVAVSLIPIPGAVGASEGGFVLLFKTLFSAGLITSAMLVSRGVSYYMFLLISGFVVFGVHLYATKRKAIRVKSKNT